jgi:hypothetical protein
MIPIMILFAEITAVICAVGAIIFCVLLFSDWDKENEHSEHAHDSEHGH